MSDIYKASYTAPIPDGADIRRGKVTWTDGRGKKREGKLITGRDGSKKVVIEGSVWMCRYRDEHGKQRKVSTGCRTKEGAQHFLYQREIEIERIRLGIVSRDEIESANREEIPIQKHLADFDASRKATDVTPRQIDDVKKKLEDFFSSIDAKSLSDVRQSHIERHIVSRKEKGIATQTINNDLSALRSFFTWCHENDRIEENPMRRIKQLSRASGNKTERRAFTEEELTRFFEAVRERRGKGNDFRYERELIYLTLLGTGLRSSELASITVAQVTPTHLILESPHEKNRKGTHQPITEPLYEKLKEWISFAKKTPKDNLFTFDKYSIFGYFKRDCRAAGINRVDDRGHVLVVHSFRKTFGTRLARAGVPLTTTQRLMRHSSPDLTAKYYIDVTPIELTVALSKIKLID